MTTRNKLITALSAPNYSAKAKAFFAASSALGAPISPLRKAQYDNLIFKPIEAAGAWTPIDALWIQAAATTPNAYLNLKTPGTFTLTETGPTPTFLADRGVTGSAAASGLAGPNLNTFGGQFSLNSAHMGVWCGTDVTEGAPDIGNGNELIRAHHTTTTVLTRANDGTSTTTTLGVNTAVGHTLWSRDNSANYKVFKNAVDLTPTPIAVATTSITNSAMTICFVGALSSTKRIQAAHIGAALTPSQVTAIYNALASYMTAVGA